MNFDKTLIWITGIVLFAAASGQLPRLQFLIWKAQAHVIKESRTSTWGSPRFFPHQRFIPASK